MLHHALLYITLSHSLLNLTAPSSPCSLHAQDVKESVLDTQLIYALARINKLSELEELISGPNVAKIDQIGTYLNLHHISHLSGILMAAFLTVDCGVWHLDYAFHLSFFISWCTLSLLSSTSLSSFIDIKHKQILLLLLNHIRSNRTLPPLVHHHFHYR